MIYIYIYTLLYYYDICIYIYIYNIYQYIIYIYAHNISLYIYIFNYIYTINGCLSQETLIAITLVFTPFSGWLHPSRSIRKRCRTTTVVPQMRNKPGGTNKTHVGGKKNIRKTHDLNKLGPLVTLVFKDMRFSRFILILDICWLQKDTSRVLNLIHRTQPEKPSVPLVVCTMENPS